MNPFQLYKRDTRVIEIVFKIYSWINVILGSLIAFVTLIVATIQLINGDANRYTMFIIFVVSALATILAHLFLHILFGFFYDIRKIRISSDSSPVNREFEAININDIPEI